MAIFAVTSLFTNRHVEEAVHVIRKNRQEDWTLQDRKILPANRVANLLEMCLKSIYSIFGGAFYKEKQGTTMGFSVSVIVVNMYMDFLKNWSWPQHRRDPRSESGMWMTTSDEDRHCEENPGPSEWGVPNYPVHFQVWEKQLPSFSRCPPYPITTSQWNRYDGVPKAPHTTSTWASLTLSYPHKKGSGEVPGWQSQQCQNFPEQPAVK